MLFSTLVRSQPVVPRFVYTTGSTYSPGAINGYTVDGAGALAPMAASPFTTGASVLQRAKVDPSGRFLYLPFLSGAQLKIAGYMIDAGNGALTPIAGSPFAALDTTLTAQAAANCALVIDPLGRFLYLAQDNQSIIGYTIDSTGALTPIAGLNLFVYSGITAMAVEQSGQFLYAATTQTTINIFMINGTSGMIWAVGVVELSSNTPGGLVAHPSGPFLYNATEDGISAYIIATGNGGRLSLLPDSPRTDLYNTDTLVIDPSGRFLYSATAAHTTGGVYTPAKIYAFAVNQGGSLIAIAGSPFFLPGASDSQVFGLTVDASGRFLYAVEQNNNPSVAAGPVVYQIDSISGVLTLVSGSPFATSATGIVAVGLNQATLVSLELKPDNPTVLTPTGLTSQQFVLLGNFSDGSTRFLTESATWSTSNPSVAICNIPFQSKGLVETVRWGSTAVIASYGDKTVMTTLTVSSPPLSAIVITPAKATIPAGTVLPFTATGVYGDGSRLNLSASVTWTSSVPAVATVGNAGLVTALAAGVTTIGAASGAITGSATLTVSAAPAAATKVPRFVYTTGSIGGPGAINGYTVDAGGGALAPMTASPFPTSASILQRAKVDPSGRFLYLPFLSGQQIKIAGYMIDAGNGALTPIAGSPLAALNTTLTATAAADCPLVIDPLGRFLYLAQDNQMIFGYAIDGTGSLSPISGLHLFVSGGISAMAVEAAGQYLYVATTQHSINAYKIDANNGTLSTAGSAYLSNNAYGGLTAHPSGGFLYAATNDGIAAYSITSGTGVPSPLPDAPYATDLAPLGDTIVLDPTGRFLYSATRLHASGGQTTPAKIYGFVVNQSSGGLIAIEGSPFSLPGAIDSSVYGIVADASGRFLYAVEENSSPSVSAGPVVYQIDSSSGALTAVSGSPFATSATGIVAVGLNQATLVSLELTPANPTLLTPTGQTSQQFLLVGHFSDGSARFLTESATWSTSNPSVAICNIPFQRKGLVETVTWGSTAVTASYGGKSVTTTLTVSEPPLVSIAVNPPNATIPAGTALPFTAMGGYGDGSVRNLSASATWTSSAPAVATVSNAGLVTALAAGVTTISAASGAIADSATLTVAEPPAAVAKVPRFVYTTGSIGSPDVIVPYSVDVTGALSQMVAPPFTPGPSTFQRAKIDPSGRFLYLPFLSGTQLEIAGATIDTASGWLAAITGSPFAALNTTLTATAAASCPLVIDPLGRFLYLAQDNQSIVGYTISSTGALTPIAGLNLFVYGGIIAMAVGASGQYLYAATTQHSINVYIINGSSGMLESAPSGGPGSSNAYGGLTLNSSGSFLYAATDDGIAVYSIASGNGALSLLPDSPYAADLAAFGDTIVLDPSGRFLYSGTRLHTSGGQTTPARIYGFVVNQASGGLIAMQGSPFSLPGAVDSSLRGLVADASGRFLYAVEQNGSPVIAAGPVVYQIDSISGALTPVSGSPFATSATGIVAVAGEVNASTKTTLISSLPSGSVYGQSVTFTASVIRSSNNAAIAEGCVTFTEGSTTLAGPTPLNAGGQAQFSTTALAASGAHTITAAFSDAAGCGNGTGTYMASNSSINQSVSVAQTTTAPVNANAVFGQSSVTLSADVTANAPSSASVNQGTMTFTVRDAANNVVGTATSGTVAGNPVTTSLNLAGVNAGNYSINAAYNPPASGASFVSSSGSAALTIRAAATTTEVSNTSAVFGDISVTLSANVMANDPSTAAVNQGTVTFTLRDAGNNLVGTTTSGQVSGNPVTASFTIPAAMNPGNYSISAAYNAPAGGNFAASSSSNPGTLALGVRVTTSVIGVAPSPQQFSDPVTFSATLAPASANGQAPATGVTFSVGNTVIGSAALALDGGGLKASLSAPLIQAALPAGTYTVTAHFTGLNSGFTVTDATSSLTVSPESPMSIAYTGDTLVFTTSSGAAVNFQATVTQPNDGSLADFNLLNTGGQRLWVDFYVSPDGTAVPGSTSPVCSAVVKNSTVTPGAGVAGCAAVVNTASYIVTAALRQAAPYFSYTLINLQQMIVATNSDSALTVANSGGPSTTGGGWVTDLSSTNGKSNFGISAHYNKQYTNLQGNSVLVFRTTQKAACLPSICTANSSTGAVDVQVKTNNLSGIIQVPGTTNEVRLSAKASVQIIDAVTGLRIGGFGAGNVSNFNLTVLDGTVDQYGLVVRAPDGTVYKLIGTLNSDGTVNPVPIGGGQIIVRQE